MNIPSSFNEMTVRQFMDWNRIMSEGDDVITREYKLLAALLGKELSQVEDMPIGELKPLFKKMKDISLSKPSDKPKRVIMVNKKPYIAIVNPKDLRELLSANQYTAFKQYTKQDTISNMHRILALLYTPYKLFRKQKIAENTEALSKEFFTAKLGDVYGFVFFLGIQYNELMKCSQQSLNSAIQTIDEHMKEVMKVLGNDSKTATDGMPS